MIDLRRTHTHVCSTRQRRANLGSSAGSRQPIVTGLPNELCRPIHERMPVTLPREAWQVWLGEIDASPEELLTLLQPYPGELMRVYPVGPAVGSVRNDKPGLLEP